MSQISNNEIDASKCVVLKAPPVTALIAAVEAKKDKLVYKLLEEGADPNEIAPGYANQTPLITAVGNNDIKLVKLLWQGGAYVNLLVDISPPDKACTISLHTSAYTEACLFGSLEILEFLQEKGALSERDRTNALLSLARVPEDSRERVLARLVNFGIDINTSMEGTTALMAANDLGIDKEFIRVMVSKGADTNRQDTRGRTALHIFLQNVLRSPIMWSVFESIIRDFLEYGTDISIPAYDGVTAYELILHVPSAAIRALGMTYLEKNRRICQQPAQK